MTPPVFIIGETAYRRWKLWQMNDLPTVPQICAMFSVSPATAKRDRSLIVQAQHIKQSIKRNHQ